MSEFQERRAAAAAEAAAQPGYPAPPVPIAEIDAALVAENKRLDVERDREIEAVKRGEHPEGSYPQGYPAGTPGQPTSPQGRTDDRRTGVPGQPGPVRFGVDGTPYPGALAAPAHVLTAHERDMANSRFAPTIPAPLTPDPRNATRLGDWAEPRFKVGQRVTVNLGRRRGRVNAIVTKSNAVPGKKQELVECRTADGTVQEYWTDELA